MKKNRRVVSATELRVHLGEILRSLETQDIVVEKGGLPVAMVVRYESTALGPAGLRYYANAPVSAQEYEAALSQRADPGGAERMDAAMAAGWAGIDADELTANVYRWREEGATSRFLSPSEDDDQAEDEDGGEVSGGQRYLYQSHPQTRRIAEKDGPGYSSGGAGD